MFKDFHEAFVRSAVEPYFHVVRRMDAARGVSSV